MLEGFARLKDFRAQLAAVGRDSWILFVAITIANASNYVFHVVLSRLMDPGDYGALNAVLAILIWLSVPFGAVQTTVAKRLAARREGDENENLFRPLMIVGLALALVFAFSSPLLQRFLRLDSIWTALFVATYVLPALALTVCRGVFQGRLQFHRLALVSVLPMLVRLAVGIPLVRAGAGVPGAVAASVIAETLGVMLSLWLLTGDRSRIFNLGARSWKALKEVLPALSGLAAMWLLIELDVILARRFLVPDEAGAYAAAGLLARAVLFVPGAVSLVALPHFSRQRGRGADAHKWLLSTTALVVGLGVGTAIVLAVAADLAVGLTFGEKYAAAAGYLPMLAFAMVGMGLANLLVFFHIAAGSRIFQMLWLIVAAEAAAIALLHSGGSALPTIVAITAWITAVFGFLAARSVSLSPVLVSRLPRDSQMQGSDPVGTGESPEISLVVPSYNGGLALERSVRGMIALLDTLDRPFEVIVVSDGSTDDSARTLQRVSPRVSVIHYGQRHGKGVALRVGMTSARGRYVAFADGDGDLDVVELKSFLTLMDMYDPDMVIGSKRHPLSVVEYPSSRRIMSWCYQRLVRLLFGLNVRDTQTGMKLIRRDVLDAVLPRMLEKRYAFDLEFLVVARRLGYTRFFEAPVKLNYRFSSTISPRAVFRILLDTAAIFYRCYILRFYDFPLPEPLTTTSSAYSAQMGGLAEHAAGP
jgi:O-antigen/teichoic acid export membrane protein/glycosyltransferase involved in cell wall biosynthesis